MLRSFILISILLLSKFVCGQVNLFKGTVIDINEFASLNTSISKYDIFQIDAGKIHQYLSDVKANTNIQLVLGSKYSFNLDLRENKIFKPGIKARVVTEKGIEAGEISSIKCYQGNIKESTKLVAISVDQNFFSGFITLDHHVLYFEPLSYFIKSAPDNYYVFYYAEDYIETKEYKCLALETENYKKNLEKKIGAINNLEFAPLACKEVEIAEASDKLMCAHYGSITAVQNRITSIVNDVQSNYCCNFNDNLSLIISDWFNVGCNGTDPWTNSTDPELVLISFTDWAPSFFGQHDVGELFTYRDLDGSTLGVAWLGTICTEEQYNLIQDWTTSSSLMRVTVAHEIGHNFNCIHDAQGAPFIMAPSVSNTNTWSALSLNAFNAFVPGLNCLAGCNGNPPITDFESTVVYGCKALSVNFSDLSSNDPTNWSWSFPGGTPNTSSVKNPVVVYNTVGTYNVTLTTTNSSGSNTLTKTNYITVIDKPIAGFGYTKNQGQVQFTSTSTNALLFSWSFGDGEVSNEENPYHEYAAPGTYTVKLTVTNDCGTNSKTISLVLVFIPQANFSSDVAEGCVPLTINFKDESSFFPTSWLWTFPGGSPSSSSSKNPTVVYTVAGEYDVILEVSNSAGSNSISKSKYIKVKTIPVANFAFSLNGQSVNFINTTIGNGNSYHWDFGDGNSSNEINPVHIYTLENNYSVSLTVNNSCGSSVKTSIITVMFPPIAGFSSIVTSGCKPLAISFNNTSTNNATYYKWSFPGAIPDSSSLKDPVVIYPNEGVFTVKLIAGNAIGEDTLILNNYIIVKSKPKCSFEYSSLNYKTNFINKTIDGVNFQWLFGDGDSSTLKSPIHNYKVEGNYIVQLTAYNECGYSLILDTVKIVFPPVANFFADNTSACDSISIVFNDLSSAGTSQWKWFFPGGFPDSSVLQNPVIKYSNPGSYDIILIANNSGGSDTIIKPGYVQINSTSPIAQFGYNNFGVEYNFINQSNDAISSYWNFGDGTFSIENNPVHTYQNSGSFNVELIAINPCGADTFYLNIEVIGIAPKAEFETNINMGCVPLTVQYTDKSVGGANNWQWNFPGGNPPVSIEQNPVVIYSTAGTYKAELIVSNNFGSDTINQLMYIVVKDLPTAKFIFTSQGNQFTFINTSTGANTYLWDFGDGTTSTEENPTHQYSKEGNYNVILIAENECGSFSFSQNIDVKVSTSNVGYFEYLKLFPNPNSGVFNIDLNSKQNAIIKLSITDILGREIMNTSLDIKAGNNTKEIRLTNLNEGQYFVTFRADTFITVRKIELR